MIDEAPGQSSFSPAIRQNSFESGIAIDEAGLILRFDAGAERTFGYSADEVIGKNVRLLMPEPYQSAHDQYLADYRRTGEAHIIGIGRKVTAARKDGSSFPAQLSVTEIEIGGARAFSGILRDITAQVAADAENRARELALNAVGTVALDLTGTILGANARFLEMMGYSEAEVIGRSDLMFWHHDDRNQRSFDEFFAQVALGKIHRGRFLRIGNNGEEIWVEATYAPVRGTDGVPVSAIKIATDITDQKKLEIEALTKGELLDMAPVAIMVRAANGRIEYWNKGAEQLYGWSSDEAIGKSCHAFLGTVLVREAEANTQSGKTLSEISESLDDAGWQGELSHLTKAGKRIPVWSRWAIRPDVAADDAVIEINVDISAEKSNEAALQEKNQQIEAAGRIDRIGSRVMTAFNRNSAAPEAVADALEVLSDEVGYKPLALYEYDDWQAKLTLLGGLALGPKFDGRAYQLGEGLVGKAAATRGAEFLDSISESAWALDTGTGELPAATVFAIPLTFREQLIGCLAGASAIALSERERSWLGQIADQMAIGLRSIQQFTQLKALSDELSDRSRRIELQNVELAETSRLKSDFLSSMSHELRTPLNAIIGFSELLKDGLLGELPSEQLDYTTEIYNAGTHLLSLINDILDLSKIEAGKMDLDVESVELGPLVENSIGIVKGLASTNGVELKTHMDPSVTTIEADARKLRQIIYNLLSNAVKFTPHGGHVAVEVIARGSNVEIAVTDTGIGIPQESLGQIFNAFEQLDSGISRSFEGTGLGLQMVRSLAELHGGEACVSSEVGRGSRFWVRLPQSQADRALSDRAPSDMAPSDTAPSDTAPSDMVPSEEFPHAGVESSSAPGAILVVEPDTRQAEVIRESLVRIGLTAVITTDTVAAQERARDQSFDALVVDVETCVSEQGLSFLVARDSNVELSDLPLIVLSTSKNDPTAVDLRATCVVPKPVAGDEMVAALRSLGLDSVGEQSRSTALVVDDDPRAVSYVCRVLEAAGMTTERAFGGQQALEAIAGSNFDVVVLDLMMPEVSGFDVLFQLRADPITHDLPVLVLTAKSLTASERASLEQMASAVVAKGRWRGSGFAEVVRDAIDRSKVDPTLGQVRDDTSAVTGRAAVAGESGAHILVLEDQKRERELLQMYLQSSGYRVTVAASAEQATARLGETMPDLVTVDINLPGMDGLTFVELLRKNPRYSELPVLVMSGADEPDQAAGFGASMVLPKPIQRTPFLEAIDNLLGDISRPVPE